MKRFHRCLAGVWIVVCILAAAHSSPAPAGEPAAESAAGAVRIQLFTSPDESSAPVQVVSPDEIVSAVAQSLGPGGAEWYLVRTKNGATGWIKAGETNATKTYNRSFKSLSNEPSADLAGARSAGPARRGTAVIPVDAQGSLAIVAVTFNHRLTANLAVDTGASKTMISRRIAEQLGLPSLGSGLFTGIGGTVSGSYTRLDSVKVGEAEVSNLIVAVHDFSRSRKYEGLLGLDFLRNFNVALDTAKQKLVLTPR